jgi:hypothetical protein
MRKDLKYVLGAAGLGLAITAVMVAYMVVADSSHLQPPNLPLVTTFVILCPPSLLSAPFIDVDPGTGGFYIIWSFIGLFNAALYAVIGASVVRLRAKSDRADGKPTGPA